MAPGGDFYPRVPPWLPRCPVLAASAVCMKQSVKNSASEGEPVRILGRELRAKRGVRLTLRAVREAIGKTQAAVASESNIDQADVSGLENRSSLDETQLATLGCAEVRHRDSLEVREPLRLVQAAPDLSPPRRPAVESRLPTRRSDRFRADSLTTPQAIAPGRSLRA